MERENLFTINGDDEDGIIDYEEFVLQREGEALAKKHKELDERLFSNMKKHIGKGVFIEILPYLFVMIGVYALITAVEIYIETKVLSLVPTLATMICAFLAGVFFLVRKNRNQKSEADADTDFDSLNRGYDTYHEEVKAELSVPETAKEVTVFAQYYASDSLDSEVYSPIRPEVFVRDENLCFYYDSAIIGFPIADIRGIERVDEPISFDDWDDDVPYNRGKYMEYKISMKKTKDDEEIYSMKGYYSLRLEREEQPFEIIIPLFDIATIWEVLEKKPVDH